MWRTIYIVWSLWCDCSLLCCSSNACFWVARGSESQRGIALLGKGHCPKSFNWMGQNQEQHLILLTPCWVPSLFPSQHGFHPYICAKRPFQIFLANGEHCFVLPVSTWLSYLLMRLSHMRKLENWSCKQHVCSWMGNFPPKQAARHSLHGLNLTVQIFHRLLPASWALTCVCNEHAHTQLRG